MAAKYASLFTSHDVKSNSGQPDTLDHSVIELALQSQLHVGHLRRVGNAEKVGEHTSLGSWLELRLAMTSRVVTVVHSVGVRRPDRDLAVRGLA